MCRRERRKETILSHNGGIGKDNVAELIEEWGDGGKHSDLLQGTVEEFA